MDPIKRPSAFLALVIVLTILACVVIKPLASAEADTLASSLSSPSVTLIHPAPNIDVYFDQKGNSEPIYHQGPGPSWFSLQDRSGRIVAQGYRSDPLPRPEPMMVPRSSSSSSDPFDYPHRDMSGLTR